MYSNNEKSLLKKSINENDSNAIRFLLNSGIGRNKNYWGLADECIMNEKFNIAFYLIQRGARGSIKKIITALLKERKYDTLIKMISYFSKKQLYDCHIYQIKDMLEKLNVPFYSKKEIFIIRLLNTIRICYEVENATHITNILHIYSTCLNSMYDTHKYTNINYFNSVSNALFELKTAFPDKEHYSNIERYLNFFNIIHSKTHDNYYLHCACIDEYKFVISNAIGNKRLELIDEYMVHKNEYFTKFVKDIMDLNVYHYYNSVHITKYSNLSTFTSLLLDEEEHNEADLPSELELRGKRIYPEEDEPNKRTKY